MINAHLNDDGNEIVEMFPIFVVEMCSRCFYDAFWDDAGPREEGRRPGVIHKWLLGVV